MGHSVSDDISSTLCSLKYLMVDQAARVMAECGQGTLMAKVDLHNTYRHVPIHIGNQHLLGLEWNCCLCWQDPLVSALHLKCSQRWQSV